MTGCHLLAFLEVATIIGNSADMLEVLLWFTSTTHTQAPCFSREGDLGHQTLFIALDIAIFWIR
jgi:hypothetical protein